MSSFCFLYEYKIGKLLVFICQPLQYAFYSPRVCVLCQYVAAHLICADKTGNRLAFDTCLILSIYKSRTYGYSSFIFDSGVYLFRSPYSPHTRAHTHTHVYCTGCENNVWDRSSHTKWPFVYDKSQQNICTMQSLTQFTRMNVTHADTLDTICTSDCWRLRIENSINIRTNVYVHFSQLKITNLFEWGETVRSKNK